MKIYFKNLEERYRYFIDVGSLKRLKKSNNLILAHLEKSEHNFELSNFLPSNYNDWKVVSIYYSLYHACLALLATKNFSSKNHTATLIFLIRNFSEFTRDDIKLLEELQLKEQDAIFYMELKNIRHNASYTTNTIFTDEDIRDMRTRSLRLINKIKDIIDHFSS